jgi:hypothetical protein
MLGYWREICIQIQNGIVPSGNDLQILVDEVAQTYPSNPLFQQYCSASSQSNNSSDTTQPSSDSSQTPQASNNDLFTILIRGRDDVDNVLASARVIAPAENISSDHIRLRFLGNGIVLLAINDCNSDEIASFSQGLQTILQSGQNQVQVNVMTEDPQPYLISRIFVQTPDEQRVPFEDVPSNTTVEEFNQQVEVRVQENNPEIFQDSKGKRIPFTINRINEDGLNEPLNREQTLHEANIQENETFNFAPEVTEDSQTDVISRILVEGPDQSRFEILNVSSNTTVGEIAKGVVLEAYDPKMFQDSRGRGRPVVVDRVSEDRSTERLNQDLTLEEANIQEGDVLSFAPEATAGVINPQLRQEALARARNQIMAYAQTYPGFQVSANAHQAPTDYLLKFSAPGFAPPPEPSGQPQPIDNHEVYLALPGAFPMQAPQAFWQTPIFHPNIEPKSGFVCLGALGDRYLPGLDFGELCQLLVDIASYQNYAVEDGYNKEAQEWAVSQEGQIAIEKRGGQCVLRKLIHEVQTPPKLNIKRLKQ